MAKSKRPEAIESTIRIVRAQANAAARVVRTVEGACAKEPGISPAGVLEVVRQHFAQMSIAKEQES